MALGTIISLLSLLAGLGVKGLKANAQNKEEDKASSRDLQMQVEEKGLKEQQEADARREAIARAIRSKNVTMPRYYDAKLTPYNQKNLSGYDTAGAVVGSIGNLAASAASGAPKADDMVSAAGESSSVADPYATYNSPAQPMPFDTDTIDTGSDALAKGPDRYKKYLSQRSA